MESFSENKEESGVYEEAFSEKSISKIVGKRLTSSEDNNQDKLVNEVEKMIDDLPCKKGETYLIKPLTRPSSLAL